jgi:hypothetical protein
VVVKLGHDLGSFGQTFEAIVEDIDLGSIVSFAVLTVVDNHLKPDAIQVFEGAFQTFSFLFKFGSFVSELLEALHLLLVLNRVGESV